jgi:hypothetical protein
MSSVSFPLLGSHGWVGTACCCSLLPLFLGDFLLSCYLFYDSWYYFSLQRMVFLSWEYSLSYVTWIFSFKESKWWLFVMCNTALSENISFFSFFFMLEFWTKGPTLVRQVLYHLSHASSPLFCFFKQGLSMLPKLVSNVGTQVILLSASAFWITGTTDVHHHTQLRFSTFSLATLFSILQNTFSSLNNFSLGLYVFYHGKSPSANHIMEAN